MGTFYRVYAKFEGQTRFKPLDLSTGQQVTNLIHATIIPSWQLEGLKTYLKEVKQDQSEIEFRINKIK